MNGKGDLIPRQDPLPAKDSRDPMLDRFRFYDTSGPPPEPGIEAFVFENRPGCAATINAWLLALILLYIVYRLYFGG